VEIILGEFCYNCPDSFLTKEVILCREEQIAAQTRTWVGTGVRDINTVDVYNTISSFYHIRVQYKF